VTTTDTGTTGRTGQLSILVAEDVPINQKLIERVLEKLGHTVTIAQNGAETLQLWHHAHFDLIFMDIEMPVMDGVSATAAIREIERQRGGHIPISAMTAHALQGDAEKYLAAGMDAYISKPFKSSEVSAVILQLTTTT
jgi:CheY-like chemotaxis protein